MFTQKNLGRNISQVLTHQQFKADLDTKNQLKVGQFMNNTADTTSSTLVQNSQTTIDKNQDHSINSFKGDVFALNAGHINLFDNSIVEKLPSVSYSISLTSPAPGEPVCIRGNLSTVFQAEDRPLRTFDTIFETKTKKRLQKYHVKLLERTNMDTEAIKKQLDLETMTIEVNIADDSVREEFLKAKGQCIQPRTRDITVEPNVEGKAKRLYNEIIEMSKAHGITDEDEVFKLFEACCCSKKHFKMALEKKTFSPWTEIEDLVLRDPESKEYKELCKVRSMEDIEQRKRFLG